MITKPSTWPAATLYFTGNKELNVRMREIAKSHNLTLNEYGLSNELINIPVTSEKDIFHFLGMDYIEPEDRDV